LPVAAAGQHLALESRAGDPASGDGNEPFAQAALHAEFDGGSKIHASNR
jgi:hypothetical protein